MILEKGVLFISNRRVTLLYNGYEPRVLILFGLVLSKSMDGYIQMITINDAVPVIPSICRSIEYITREVLFFVAVVTLRP